MMDCYWTETWGCGMMVREFWVEFHLSFVIWSFSCNPSNGSGSERLESEDKNVDLTNISVLVNTAKITRFGKLWISRCGKSSTTSQLKWKWSLICNPISSICLMMYPDENNAWETWHRGTCKPAVFPAPCLLACIFLVRKRWFWWVTLDISALSVWEKVWGKSAIK